MEDSLTTAQVERLADAKPFTAVAYVRLGVLSPRRIGTGRGFLVWTKPQAVALYAAQVLMRAGMRGQPVYGVMQLIGQRSEADLHRIYESTPLIAIVPGAAVLARWVSREEFETRAWDLLDEFHVHPFAMDIEKLHAAMNERIAWFNQHEWRVDQQPKQSAA
jgi:hypothetical protein